MERKIIWAENAQAQLIRLYENILKRSFQGAEKVREDILKSTRALATNPERFSRDKYKKKNDGSFRAYELHGFRIAFQITPKAIFIIRVRHVKMEPKRY